MLLDHALLVAQQLKEGIFASNGADSVAILEPAKQENEKAIALLQSVQLALRLNLLDGDGLDSLHAVTLDLARERLKKTFGSRVANFDRLAGFSAQEIAQAAAESAKRYASLSRALRGLREHGLIQEVTWKAESWSTSERQYRITTDGLQRLSGVADKDLPF
jgi:hypothetical protein